jgi:hypothetical protein
MVCDGLSKYTINTSVKKMYYKSKEVEEIKGKMHPSFEKAYQELLEAKKRDTQEGS